MRLNLYEDIVRDYIYIKESYGAKNAQYNIVKLPEIPKIEWKKNGSHNNAIIKFNGMNLRYRCEVLVFNEDYTEVYLCMRDNEDGSYYIPGGGAEPDKTMEEQIEAETREEAGFEIKNVRHSGIQFTKMFNGEPPEWHKEELHPHGVYYDGYFTELFIAQYDGPLRKEVKNKIDIDQYMRKNGKFYNINNMKNEIRREHMNVILELNMIKDK